VKRNSARQIFQFAGLTCRAIEDALKNHDAQIFELHHRRYDEANKPICKLT
jgi:hypothetical protein